MTYLSCFCVCIFWSVQTSHKPHRWHSLKELITYHRLGLWQRCFCGEQQYFWPHTCSCLYLPAGLFWWRDYGQPWWKNWGHLLGRSHPRFSATPPENMFQWAKINCLSIETVSSCVAVQWSDVMWIREIYMKMKGERYIFRAMKQTEIKTEYGSTQRQNTFIYTPYCYCSFYFVVARYLCSLFFLFWWTFKLACLFPCSHLTLCCLKSSYSMVALLLVLLPVAMPDIIVFSSSCVPCLFSPVVTYALMFFSAELRLAPSFPFLCKLSLHCQAVIG